MKNSKLDYNLITLLLLLIRTSCIAILNAQDFGQYEGNFLFRQITWYIVGIGIIAGIMYLDSEQIFRLNWFIYSFSIILLIALILAPESIAREINGAKSWFQLPGIGSLQPAEFTKISLIICLSFLEKHHEKYLDKSLKTDLLLLIKMGAATALPILLIMLTTRFRYVFSINMYFYRDFYYFGNIMENYQCYFYYHFLNLAFLYT